jgi:hypothetical protein
MNIRAKIQKRRQDWLENPYITISERTVGGRTFVRARANWPNHPRSINIDVVIKDAWKFKSLRDPRLEQLAEKKILEKINLLTNEKINDVH